MKRPKLKTTSRYWRVRVDATMEEKDFARFEDCVGWAITVKNTFMDETLTFTVTQITERSCQLFARS